MKRFFLILVLALGSLVPIKANAVDLKLTYDNDFKKKIYSQGDIQVLPSYDNEGNINGHLFFYKDNNIVKRKIGVTDMSARAKIGMFKLDLNNNLVYSKGDEDVYVSDISVNKIDIGDGTFDILITGYDESGEVLFETEYGGSGDEEYYRRFNSFNDKGEHDGYLIVLGSTSSGLKIDPGVILIKIDLKGKLVWEKNINEFLTGARSLLYVVDKKIDSIFRYNYNGAVFRTKVDAEESIWKKDSGIEIVNLNYSYNESGVIDGIVVVGMDSNTKGVIIKYDLDGNEIFRYSYNSTNESAYTGVISSMYVDGKYDGYIVMGITADNKTLIIKYDYSGNIVWTDEYSDNEILFMNVIRNYDNTGKPNGYLLYQVDSSFDKRKNLYNSTFNSYKVKQLSLNRIGQAEYQYKVAKYTYENYLVKKDEDEKGNITISNSMAYPGEIVKVSVSPKEGYALKRIVVIDENGKEIEVSKDGTFVMPDGKVTVTAIYNRITNPKTVSACYVVLGIILLVSIGTLIVNKKKESI